jgi:hypothetical protein
MKCLCHLRNKTQQTKNEEVCIDVILRLKFDISLYVEINISAKTLICKEKWIN